MLLAGSHAVTGTVPAMTMLRQGLLEGRAVALAGGVTPAVREALAALGARVEELDAALDEDAAREWSASFEGVRALVYDARGVFAAGGQDALRHTLEQAWVATRALATGALIPAGAGKVVLIGPRPDAGTFATAVRAALENLARTLSVEWARFGVGAVAIAPGPQTAEDDVAELVCFLASPAGEYFTGCVFELGLGLGQSELR
jgi:NAD(P)-dependent dehydrogenase (short-subunit alcohol dehydrogenase family)